MAALQRRLVGQLQPVPPAQSSGSAGKGFGFWCSCTAGRLELDLFTCHHFVGLKPLNAPRVPSGDFRSGLLSGSIRFVPVWSPRRSDGFHRETFALGPAVRASGSYVLTPAGGWTPLPGGWKLAARRAYRAEPSSPAVRTQNPGTVCRMAPVCVRDQLASENRSSAMSPNTHCFRLPLWLHWCGDVT